MLSNKTAKGIGLYNDSDRPDIKSDWNSTMKKIDDLLTSGGTGTVKKVNDVSPDEDGNVVISASDIKDSGGQTIEEDLGELESVIIGASSHTTKEGYVVPVLTNEEITQAYNGIVAGKKVIIVDDMETLYMSVYDASNIDGISIKAIFTDKLILTYKVGATLKQGTKDVNADPTIDVSLIGKFNKETWTFTLDDGTEVDKDVVLVE